VCRLNKTKRPSRSSYWSRSRQLEHACREIDNDLIASIAAEVARTGADAELELHRWLNMQVLPMVEKKRSGYAMPRSEYWLDMLVKTRLQD
jgi:hypothetical protein